MILTVDKKKRFLVTMIVIMACATAINYGLYNVLSTYFKVNDAGGEDSLYSGVQLNIIIILVVIAVVTVIMVVLIPKENVSELMARISSNSNDSSTVLTGGSNLKASSNEEDPLGTDYYDKELDDMVDEDIEEGLDIGEKK